MKHSYSAYEYADTDDSTASLASYHFEQKVKTNILLKDKGLSKFVAIDVQDLKQIDLADNIEIAQDKYEQHDSLKVTATHIGYP